MDFHRMWSVYQDGLTPRQTCSNLEGPGGHWRVLGDTEEDRQSLFQAADA